MRVPVRRAFQRAGLSALLVVALVGMSFLLTFSPGIITPLAATGQTGNSPVGPLATPPTWTTTIPQGITLSDAESHYCTTCTMANGYPYPDLYGVVDDYFEAKVQPNGWGTTWYIHFPTTNGIVTNSLETTQSYDETTQTLNFNLMGSNTKLPMADRLALTYSINLATGYEEIDVTNITAIKAGSGTSVSLEYSNVVETGDVFQFVPYPNGLSPSTGPQLTVAGNCETGTPTCLYSSGYTVFGEASLTRTCAYSSGSTTSYSGTKTTHSNIPGGDCALGQACQLHSTATVVSSTTSEAKSETCTYSSSTTCSATNTSATFTTSAKLPACDESNWTPATVLHNWGDTNPPTGDYQQVDVLENSWEITASTSSGQPIAAIQLSDVTTAYGNRTQKGVLEWLDDYTQEYLGFNEIGTFYSIVPSSAPSSSNCKSFILTIPTSRGTLSGTIKVTPYIGTGCPVAKVPNPYVGYLSGSMVLKSTSGSVTYTITGVALEFMCNRNTLSTCELPVATSTSVSCSPAPATAGQGTTCTATVTDSGSAIRAFGVVNFSSNDTLSFSSSSCSLPAPTVTSSTASCSVTFTPLSSGHALLTAAYVGDDEEVHSPSSGQNLTAVN